MKKVCYYDNDLDGISSAAIVRQRWPDAEFITAKRDELPPPAEEGQRTIVVDFSYPKEVMEQFRSAGQLIWIDHHKTAMEEMPDLWNDKTIPGVRLLTHSAAYLTWKTFHNKPVPLGIQLISDWDMWEFIEENTKEFNLAANLYLKTPDADGWFGILNNEMQTVRDYIDTGTILRQTLELRVESSVKGKTEGRLVTQSPSPFPGIKTAFVNTNHDISDVPESLKADYPLVCVWRVKGNKVLCSLRSSQIDVSEVAKQFGGGGHKYAAAFITNIKTFLEIAVFDWE